MVHKLENDIQKLRRECSDFAHKNMDLYDLRVADQIIGQMDAIAGGATPMIHELPFGSVDQKIAFAIYFSVVNFNFSQCQSTWTHGGRQYYRSKGMMYALYDAGLPWENSEQMSRVTKGQWKERLSGFVDKDFPWAEERITFLSNMAEYLQKKQVDFWRFFQQFPTADDLYLLLEASQLYRDPFLKRMQMLIGWLIDIAKEADIAIGNSSILTGLADYRLPQLFYNIKLIRLSSQERQMLMDRKKFQLQDTFVQKMRYSTVFLCNDLSKRKNVTHAEMDQLLWHLCQQMLEKGELSIPAMCVDTDCF